MVELQPSSSSLQQYWNEGVGRRPSIDPLTVSVDLGAPIDSGMTLAKHVNYISGVCFFLLRQLRIIRRSLTADAAHALVRALMHTRIDYCNGLLVSCPHDLTDRGSSPRGCQAGTAATVPIICVGSHASAVALVGCHRDVVISAPAWDRTGCEFDSWQCRIYIPCSLSLRLLGSFLGSLA